MPLARPFALPSLLAGPAAAARGTLPRGGAVAAACGAVGRVARVAASGMEWPAIAADRRLDPPAKRTRPAPHERQVIPLERTLPNERLKPHICLLGLRDDEQARGVAVEPMHDATAFPFPTRRDADESVHERPAFVAAGRMHHEPCRFVDDEQVLVLVDHGQLQLLPLRGQRPGRTL